MGVFDFQNIMIIIDIIPTEEDLRDPNLMASLKSSGMVPRLGLDCVGGKNATDLMRVLQPGSTMVMQFIQNCRKLKKRRAKTG